MKKRMFLFALATTADLLLTGCGQSQTGAQTPADSTSVSSSENSSQNAPQFPEVSPDTSVQPSETDQSAEETDSSGANSQGQEQTGDTTDAGGAGSGDMSAPHPVQDLSRYPLLLLNREWSLPPDWKRSPRIPLPLARLCPVQT